MKEHAEHVISQLSKMKEDFLKYKSRLAVVRSEIKAKQTQIQLFHEKSHDELESNKEIPDSVSEISMAESTSSRISRISMCSRCLYTFLNYLIAIYNYIQSLFFIAVSIYLKIIYILKLYIY